MKTEYADGREEIFAKHEFMPSADVAEIKSVIDSIGRPWCVFSTSASWAISPGSAKLRVDGSALHVSIRLKWADESNFVAPEGETPIVGVFRIPELAAFNVKDPRLEFFAFPLLAIPNTIRVT